MKDVSPEKKVYTLNPRGNFFDVKQKVLADNSRDDFSNKKSLFFKIFPLFFQIFETFF